MITDYLLGMAWSLTPYVEQPPNKLSPICHEKLLEKNYLHTLWRDTTPLLHWKIVWGYVLPKYLQESQTKASY